MQRRYCWHSILLDRTLRSLHNTASFCDIFLHRFRIWPFHFRCWSTWTPRYGHDTACFTLVSSSARPTDFSSSLNLFLLPSEPRVMDTVLLVLTDNRLLLNHMAASLMDCCSFVLASVNDFPVVYTALSSAKTLIEAFSMCWGRSLIKMRNNKGPNADPCGIPAWIINGDEDAPFTWTNWHLSVR